MLTWLGDDDLNLKCFQLGSSTRACCAYKHVCFKNCGRTSGCGTYSHRTWTPRGAVTIPESEHLDAFRQFGVTILWWHHKVSDLHHTSYWCFFSACCQFLGSVFGDDIFVDGWILYIGATMGRTHPHDVALSADDTTQLSGISFADVRSIRSSRAIIPNF